MSKYTKLDKIWSLIIRLRAGFKCERCGAQHEQNSRGLHPHHIFSRTFKSVRYDLENGQSLCYGCHSWSHRNPEKARARAKLIMGEQRFNLLELRKNTSRKIDFTLQLMILTETLKSTWGKLTKGGIHEDNEYQIESRRN